MLMNTKNICASLILSAMALNGGTAIAHDNAHLDTQVAPNNGQLRAAGIYHLELVLNKDSKETKDNLVLVYVTDHAGNKIPTKGAIGSATILTGKLKSTAVLLPDGDNRLKASAKYAATPDVKVVVSLTMAGKSPEQALFTPFAIKTGRAEKR